MKLASLGMVVLAVGALAACGSVNSGGTDGGGRGGGVGGSNGGSQARGGAGGGAGTTGGGAGGAAGTAGTCGGKTCTVQEICCGPAECPRCMNIPSTLCPTTCGGAGGSARGGSGGSGGTGGGTAGTGGTGGRKSCQSDGDCAGFKCCGGFCVNSGNDILNCGTCGKTCSGAHPFCNGGTCQDGWPCSLVGAACNVGSTCCGGGCCTGTQICCTVTQGPTYTGCYEPVNGSCPMGCAACACAAPTTPIATPVGDRPIADLKVGDLVYSIDHGALAVVSIKSVHRQPVIGSHRVVEVKLAHGATLRISPRHPTADGRHFADLAAGDVLDGVRITAARLVDYDLPFTYDILPDSDSGTYFAGGTLIGSTLSDRFGDFSATPSVATTSVRRASVLPRVGP